MVNPNGPSALDLVPEASGPKPKNPALAPQTWCRKRLALSQKTRPQRLRPGPSAFFCFLFCSRALIFFFLLLTGLGHTQCVTSNLTKKVPVAKPKTIKPSRLQTKLNERHKQLAETNGLESGKMDNRKYCVSARLSPLQSGCYCTPRCCYNGRYYAMSQPVETCVLFTQIHCISARTFNAIVGP